MSSFSKYPLDDRVLAALKKLGFSRPTPVQEKVIPFFFQKQNLIVEAPTGTGKTAAYGLPLISLMQLHKNSTQALVLAPSRELALQIAEALRSYYDGDMLHIGTIYGGVSMAESEAVIRSGPHIMVAVPGRLKDIMAHGELDFFWRDIKYLIMDEGDKLMEMGFQKDYDALRFHVRKRVQMGFFSATIPADAEAMMRERLKLARVVRLHPKEVLKNIDFRYINITEGQRDRFLGGLLAQEKPEQALIFCARREDVYSVTGFLRNCGYQAESYYGSIEQQERANILNRFKEKHLDFLVASDLAARGLDIIDLPCVINLSIPQQYDYYLHRVGRTGRAGNPGKVFNLLNRDYDLTYLKNHHKEIGLPVKPLKVKPLDASQLKVEEEEKWVKYQLSRGKKDKVRKGDVVGFLTKQAELSPEAIGTITIYDSYTIVDLPVKGYEVLQKKQEELTIKGKSVKIRKFSVDEQERKAKSVKRLLKDRR